MSNGPKIGQCQIILLTWLIGESFVLPIHFKTAYRNALPFAQHSDRYPARGHIFKNVAVVQGRRGLDAVITRLVIEPYSFDRSIRCFPNP
jgi:hypothetical protein